MCGRGSQNLLKQPEFFFLRFVQYDFVSTNLKRGVPRRKYVMTVLALPFENSNDEDGID